MDSEPKRPVDFWEVVFHLPTFRLRCEYAPDAMPPVCLIRHQLKTGNVIYEAVKIQPAQ